MPIVRVHTNFTVMIILAVRAPNGLEEEHVIVHIDFMLFYQLNSELVLTVGERAVFCVLAWRTSWLQKGRAKLSFVFIRVIEFFNAIVCSFTIISFRALLSFIDEWANFRLIGAERTAPILVLVMIVGTPFQVVILRVLHARLDLERVQIKEENGLFHADLARVEALAVRI